jgi:hypothetical protein
VTPANGYNDKTKVAQFAQKIKAKSMKLLISLHYSDTWSDPEHQIKPAAWADHSFSQLQADVYDHTCDVVNSLKSVDSMPGELEGPLFPGTIPSPRQPRKRTFIFDRYGFQCAHVIPTCG